MKAHSPRRRGRVVADLIEGRVRLLRVSDSCDSTFLKECGHKGRGLTFIPPGSCLVDRVANLGLNVRPAAFVPAQVCTLTPLCDNSPSPSCSACSNSRSPFTQRTRRTSAAAVRMARGPSGSSIRYRSPAAARRSSTTQELTCRFATSPADCVRRRAMLSITLCVRAPGHDAAR
jgi:hypothetical protein